MNLQSAELSGFDDGSTTKSTIADFIEGDRAVSLAAQVDEIIVGFCELKTLDFLSRFPNVTSVVIHTSTMKDISGLQSVRGTMKSLILHRPSCRMDVLGELHNLEEIFLDDWRPGATSLFALKKLQKASLRKYKLRDLVPMAQWSALQKLWVHAGTLSTLDGVPPSVRILRLTNIGGLKDISALHACDALEELYLHGCKHVSSLDGLHGCSTLNLLSISKLRIRELSPIRSCKMLRRVFLADGTVVDSGIDSLCQLAHLEDLIISRQSGLNLEQFRHAHPSCRLRVVS